MKEDIVTSIEEISREDEIVYDIGVEDSHCFFANGILIHNSPNVVIDESGLISDDIFAKIKRMLGGHKDNFLLEITNPWQRNHVFRAFHSPFYKKIFIDWRVAVKEGRMQQSFVDEMRREADFDILYECKFPEANEIDREGFLPLITEDELKSSLVPHALRHSGERFLGVDVAGHGDNRSAFVLRSNNAMQLLGLLHDSTVPENVATILSLMERYEVPENNVVIDATGGSGVAEVLQDRGISVRGVNMSEKAEQDERCLNRRAEMAFRFQKWIRSGGKIVHDDEFFEIMHIRYKQRDSSGKYKIISKDELRTRGVVSPDVYDAASLTFPDPVGEPMKRVDRLLRVQRVRASRSSYE